MLPEDYSGKKKDVAEGERNIRWLLRAKWTQNLRENGSLGEGGWDKRFQWSSWTLGQGEKSPNVIAKQEEVQVFLTF